MDLMEVVNNLIKFKTETGSGVEINKCFNYCKNLFANTNAVVEISEKVLNAPVLSISNVKTDDYDVLVLGHLDVVPAPNSMFTPIVKDGKMYGRGTLDMKSFAAVAINSMIHVLLKKLPIKFGVILSSDEEKGSKGTKAFLETHPNIKAKIVLDNDVGGDIQEIITKCKNPVFIKIISKGLTAHGSTPWEGIDANENLMTSLANLRKYYPYFSQKTGEPENTWIDTMHIAIMKGGEVSNVISDYAEALLDFRLTENSTVENLEKNIKKCLVGGVSYEISSTSTPVVMDENNPYIQDYKKFAESILGKPIKFVQIGGATDAREFAVRGSTVIMHSGTGFGMHTLDEYVEIETVKQIADIQIRFLEKLAK
ncbi:MAG: M20/M25/M40 family metallo-hydrolase [Lactobacillaceae bacterium]|jgi:succinyl-diaminopimelate desuccinylase|nr:M20/M25/M40 family metallo-hydrolase [Lactobacillaceae bacterium]